MLNMSYDTRKNVFVCRIVSDQTGRKGEDMNGIRVNPTGIRGVNRNEWESILGRFDSLADKISRALGRVTSIKEPGSGSRIARTPKGVVPGGTLMTHCG
jgi:hypothetical protein